MSSLMKPLKHAIYVAIALLIAAAIWSIKAHALEQIIRPHQSLRSAGMGGVRITTGLYDENFFGNPARATANPEDKFQIFDLHLETTFKTITAVDDILASKSDLLVSVAEKAGENLHGRVQTTFPAFYAAKRGSMSYAAGLITSTQFDVTLRRSFEVNPQAISDIGPAITVAKRFMDEDRLSVGATVHATYRLASKEGYSMVDLLRGSSLSPAQSGADGSHVDASVGGFYHFPFERLGFKFFTGASVNNVMGGYYRNLGLKVLKNDNTAPPQYRAYNVGFGASRESLWIFERFTGAFEITDIGNNKGGSVFRLLHLGGEAHWSILAPRVGINQGYFCAGLGIDLAFFSIDVATWGEEMSLNAGGLEDRRIGLKLAFQI